MLRIGYSSGAFYPETPTEETIDAAARLGIADMEIMLQTRGEYGSAIIQQLSRRARAAGVAIHSLHTMQQLHPVFDSYARRADEGWQLFERAAAAAAELGARVLVWHGACREHAQPGPASAQHLAALDRLAAICARNGILLGLENVSWCAMAQVRDVLAIASHLPELEQGHAIAFTFDVFQAAEAGANPFMILAAMERRLANVHLRDYQSGENSPRNLMPGQGEIPWPAVIRAVANAGFRGPLILEGALGSDPEETLSRVRSFLDPLIAAAATEAGGCNATMPPGLAAGIELFNRGEYYECHEEIEHEWHAERGEIRKLYQGILQIGVGFHHARSGNHRGAVLLLTDGIEKVSRFLPACLGIDTARLVNDTQHCLALISNADPGSLSELFEVLPVPVIERTGR